MNKLCDGCPAGTVCSRHKMKKNSREMEFCNGTANTDDGGLKYWNAWEEGKMGATAPDDPQIDHPGFEKEKNVDTQPKSNKSCNNCGGSKKMPPLTEQAKNLAKAVGKSILSGGKKTSKEQKKKRLNICKGCKYRAGKRCSECGCYVEPKAKLATEDCPMGFWPKIEPVSMPEMPPVVSKEPKTRKPSKKSKKTPQNVIGVKIDNVKEIKTPPHVSFISDHHDRPTDVFDGKFPNGTAFLVCGGPSARWIDWSLLERPGILTASLNNAPCSKSFDSKDPSDIFRPQLWFSVDEPRHFQETIFKDPGIAKFIKQKYRKTGRLREYNGKHWVKQKTSLQDCGNVWYFRHCKSQKYEEFLTMPEPTWGVNPHRSVMFVAIRILFYMGIRKLYLVGCDFNQDTKNSYGFDDPMPKTRANYNTRKFEQLNDIFTKLRPHFEEYGLRVINCTPEGNLNAFDRMPLEDAIESATIAIPDTIETKGMYLK